MKISQTFDGYELRGVESLADYINDHPQGLSAIVARKSAKAK